MDDGVAFEPDLGREAVVDEVDGLRFALGVSGLVFVGLLPVRRLHMLLFFESGWDGSDGLSRYL